MNSLETGQFFGVTNAKIQLGGLTLTDTEYTHDYVNWHYHENAYFTFILEGKVLEGNKKELYHCEAGSLLFHHWQEAHYNIKPPGFTRGFHLELNPEWFKQVGLSTNDLQGSINFRNPYLTTIMYNIVKEVKMDAHSADLAIDSSLIRLFDLATGNATSSSMSKPLWVNRLRDLLHDDPARHWSLEALAAELSIHPVHLSRDFSKYFNCNLGEYQRMLKVQKAVSMLPDKQRSLTDIAVTCGFADQSHFIRSFKALYHVTPLTFKKLLS
ncbi:transcriptional regulator, AraC family protein [Pedobacter sp. BAL39]|uniref:helix-turn-helix transcriptional regulator n=1 Tax=Pedobacter sp. BAL39 TaxID=391596 RepID=UPI0001559D2A|nr:AraC family transcriptional regulator [Pedobacter sp. BAL39]EDM35844.1 transcriptional regulator, AraC family protein [Pedobacter sp. BAL39]